MAWVAFVDESQSDRTRDPGVYILAAAIADAEVLGFGARGDARSSCRPPGEGSLAR